MRRSARRWAHACSLTRTRRPPHATNAFEREHEEIRRRMRASRILPSETSYLRVTSANTLDHNEVRAKRRPMISPYWSPPPIL
jgi:transposase-like protein